MMTTLHGDCREVLRTLPDASVQCCVTSPPYYGLRKYSDDSREIGQEATPALYVAALVDVFREVKRVLRDDGVVFLNLGDSYAGGGPHHGDKNVGKSGTNKGSAGGVDRNIDGLPDKNLLGIPWRVAFALQDDGWYLRSDIIWHKPNCMPESVTDRPTRSHEYVFLLSKSARYFYDASAIAEPSQNQVGSAASFKRATKDHVIPGQSVAQHRIDRTDTVDNGTRNRRTVWTIPTQPYSGAHYATMPEALIAPCILAGSAAQACEVCGAPWARVVERKNTDRSFVGNGLGVDERKALGVGGRAGSGKSTTLGFAPTCTCPDATGSAASTVLDPFAGSGTIGKVALRYQRNAVLIELNAAYIDEHIESRTDKVQIEMFV